jgi:hypothetical protein
MRVVPGISGGNYRFTFFRVFKVPTSPTGKNSPRNSKIQFQLWYTKLPTVHAPLIYVHAPHNVVRER